MKLSYFFSFLMYITVCTNALSQYVLQTGPPYCRGTNVTISIQQAYILDFFNLQPPFNMSALYVKYTADGPAFPTTNFGNNGGIIPILSNQSCPYTIQPDDWFSPTPITLKVQGYISTNGTDFELIEEAYDEFSISARQTFPDLNGPANILDPSPVQYSISTINSPPTNFVWSLPSGWNITQNNGESITVIPGAQPGQVSLTTSPQVNACNYPQTIEVTVDDCYWNGQTYHGVCETDVWSNAFPTYYGSSSTYIDPNIEPRKVGDFNGDGQDDILCFKYDHVAVGISHGSGFNTSNWSNGFSNQNTGATERKYPRKIGDFNGDGRDDIIIFGHYSNQVGLSTSGTNDYFDGSGNNFWHYGDLTYDQGFTDPNVVQRLIGDFNGDDKDDIVGFGYSQHIVALSQGNHFSTANWTSGTELTANSPVGMSDMNKFPKMVGDFNGDGRDDVIGFGNSTVSVGISEQISATQNKFTFSNWTQSMTFSQGFEQRKYPRMVGDFNGDGMDDIVAFGHTGVLVGISNGDPNSTSGSFTVSTWLLEKGFTVSSGWKVDARDFTTVDIADFGDAFNTNSIHVIKIADANGDGFDDIIGFSSHGWAVSYSDGTKFLCPQRIEEQFGNSPAGASFNYNDYRYTRTVGNFNISDDAVEIIGFDANSVEVLDCSYCDKPDAVAEMLNHDGTHVESGLHSVIVHDYCSDNISIDISQSTCEKKYFVEIHEFDLSTFQSTNVVYESGWYFGSAPNEISLGGLYSFQPDKLYMVTFGVGFNLDTESLWFRVNEPHSVLSTNANEVRTLVYQNAPPIKGTSEARIYGFCTDVNRMELDGSNSSCYDEYRVELIEVDAHMSPTGSPIVQVPYGGGWNPGPIPVPVQISTNYIPAGSIYRLKLETKNSSGSNSTYLYVETADCEVGPLPGKSLSSEEDVKKTSVVLYPNPTREEVTVQLRDITTGDISVFSVEGKKLEVQSFTDSSTIPLDVSNYDAGQYLVRIEFLDGSIETIKLVKQ